MAEWPVDNRGGGVVPQADAAAAFVDSDVLLAEEVLDDVAAADLSDELEVSEEESENVFVLEEALPFVAPVRLSLR
jgi:hypothetical protein